MTEAERLAEILEQTDQMYPNADVSSVEVAAELRRLVSFNQQLMDEVARLNKAVADEREACANVCEEQEELRGHTPFDCAAAIRARGNT